MIRRIALVLALVLAAVSARQLTCVWGCGEIAATSHRAAACHESANDDPTLAATATHCPVAPEAAVLTASKSSEPQRHRVALPFERIAAAAVAWSDHLAIGQVWPAAARLSAHTFSRTSAVLRI
jgi:hypothetical protein